MRFKSSLIFLCLLAASCELPANFDRRIDTIARTTAETAGLVATTAAQIDADDDGHLSWTEALAGIGTLLGGLGITLGRAQAAKESRKRGELWQAVSEAKAKP